LHRGKKENSIKMVSQLISLQITVSSDVTPCSLVHRYHGFGGNCCPHYQYRRESIPIQLVNSVTAAPNFVKDEVHPRTGHESPVEE